jgi:hypothetical protein
VKASLVSLLRKLEWVCIILLFLAGMAKLLSLSGQSQVLQSHDPVFGISNRSLFLYVGMLEIGLATGLFMLRQSGRPVSLPLALVGMTFLAYKGTLMYTGFTGYCACLGSLTESLGIDQGVASTALLVVAFLIAATGNLGMILDRRRVYDSQPADSQLA